MRLARSAPRIRFRPWRTLGAVAVSAMMCAAPAHAACQLSYGLKTPDAYAAYADRPDNLLMGYPKGGDGLANLVVSFVARERTGLRTTLAAVNMATPKQREAIGSGLARAAQACRLTDADLSRDIGKALDRTSDPSVTIGSRAFTMKLEAATTAPPPVKKSGPASFAELPLTGPLTSGGAASAPTDPLGLDR